MPERSHGKGISPRGSASAFSWNDSRRRASPPTVVDEDAVDTGTAGHEGRPPCPRHGVVLLVDRSCRRRDGRPSRPRPLRICPPEDMGRRGRRTHRSTYRRGGPAGPCSVDRGGARGRTPGVRRRRSRGSRWCAVRVGEGRPATDAPLVSRPVGRPCRAPSRTRTSAGRSVIARPGRGEVPAFLHHGRKSASAPDPLPGPGRAPPMGGPAKTGVPAHYRGRGRRGHRVSRSRGQLVTRDRPHELSIGPTSW